MTKITYEDFEKVEIRSGTVVKVEEFPRAKKPAYKVWVDFGPTIGVLQTSAQVTVHYTSETLLGRQVAGCVNLGERNIAGFMSQFLLLGFSDTAQAIVLISPSEKVPNGQKLH
ncbi:tRNA-binding protein [Candidatus Bealeia paramacronuclearis]|uniref:tRNA-binding protein n=1 Tax=Candidatus Bealeia paramacronuclearis TaxID=1921001 RepID=A0ABZ2C3G6_9PROT|nr:tRNA-binding protein [Candidatus Bealeia paramacronuclearis]